MIGRAEQQAFNILYVLLAVGMYRQQGWSGVALLVGLMCAFTVLETVERERRKRRRERDEAAARGGT